MKGMREGRGKWTDANGTVYEGKSFYNLAQALLRKILNMDMGKSGIAQVNVIKANLPKEIELKGFFIRKMAMLSRLVSENRSNWMVLACFYLYLSRHL